MARANLVLPKVVETIDRRGDFPVSVRKSVVESRK
jgi:hypothetical protein